MSKKTRQRIIKVFAIFSIVGLIASTLGHALFLLF